MNTALEGIRENIELSVNTLQQLKNEEQVLKKCKSDMEKNKNYTYEDDMEVCSLDQKLVSAKLHDYHIFRASPSLPQLQDTFLCPFPLRDMCQKSLITCERNSQFLPN